MNRTILRSEEAKKFTTDLESLAKEDIIDILSYFYDMNVLEISAARKSNIEIDNICANVKETKLNLLKILVAKKLMI